MRHLHVVPGEAPKRNGKIQLPERRLRPTSQFFRGRKLYSNNLGECFVVNLMREDTNAEAPSKYLIKVSEINGVLENPRYLAKVTLFRSGVYLTSFAALQWGEVSPKSPYTEHFPTRLVINACIKLAEGSLGINTIFAEARETIAASRLLELGFVEHDPKNLPWWMSLRFP